MLIISASLTSCSLMRSLSDPAVTSTTAQEQANERERHELVGSMKRVADMGGEAEPRERVLTTDVKMQDRPRRAKHLKNLKRQTPLHQAVLEGNLYSVRLLLELGANVDAKDATQCTAIHYATRYGYKEIVETLLAAGARYEAVVKDEWTALHIAAHRGYREITKLLLDAGANIEKTTADGSTALHLATNCGRTEVVRILLDGGADIDAVGPVRLTPLHIAVANGDLFVIQVLLDARATLEIRSPQGTAWQLASKTEDKEILEALVAAGAHSTFMARSVTPRSPITDGTVSG